MSASCTATSTAAASAATPTRSRRRGSTATASPSADGPDLHEHVQPVQPAPQPVDRERRAAVGLVAERRVPERAQRAPVEEDRDRHDGRGEDERERELPHRAAHAREERHQRERGELREAREGDEDAARPSGSTHASSAAEDERDGQRVVGVRVRDEERERERQPRVGEDHPRPRARGSASPEEEQQRHDREVEHERRRVRRGQVVPGPAPGQQLLEREVGEVDDRPVRVAVLVVAREVAVERLAAGEVVGADARRRSRRR